MTRGYRFAATPKWLAGHLLVLAAVVAMILLGRWQLDVSNSKHFSIQNFGYAIQWWIFSLAAIWGYSKLLRDNANGAASDEPVAAAPTTVPAEPVAYRRYVPPQAADRDGASEDAVLTNYNAYLASLDQKAQPGTDGS